MKNLRKHLSAEGLIKTIYSKFKKIKDPLNRNGNISLTDCLMSCFAIFNLKYPSLLEYDIQKRLPTSLKNLKNLYFVQKPPSDTYMRERLDSIDPVILRSAFKKIFANLQRGNVLEEYQYFDGYYLMSLDGTGHFSSEKVQCKNCLVKNHKTGKTTYHHQMLASVILHPEKPQVIPICPEPIKKQDGQNKNDCERNASKRLLEDTRREHPHLKLIIVEDALAANAPHIKLIEKLSMKYIIGVKPKDHVYLFDWVKYAKAINFEHIDNLGFHHQYRFVNDVPLNDANSEVKVNFLEYWETDKKGRKKHFTWVSNIKININNVYKLMKGGRARWKIENETFNTLKNQGYHFEHNFGHGKENLCSVMGLIMMLAFLVDQAQWLSCHLFQQAKKTTRTYYLFWQDMKTLFRYCYFNNWEQFLYSIAKIEFINTS